MSFGALEPAMIDCIECLQNAIEVFVDCDECCDIPAVRSDVPEFCLDGREVVGYIIVTQAYGQGKQNHGAQYKAFGALPGVCLADWHCAAVLQPSSVRCYYGDIAECDNYPKIAIEELAGCDCDGNDVKDNQGDFVRTDVPEASPKIAEKPWHSQTSFLKEHDKGRPGNGRSGLL
jgi:hypothetical protein